MRVIRGKAKCKYRQELGQLKQFHLEIIDRLARIETKQDGVGEVHAAYQQEFARLCAATTAQGRDLAALDREVKSLKWLAGMVAGMVAGTVQFLTFVWKRA